MVNIKKIYEGDGENVTNPLPYRQDFTNQPKFKMNIQRIDQLSNKINISLDFVYHIVNTNIIKEFSAYKSFIVESVDPELFYNKTNDDARLCVSKILTRTADYAINELNKKGIDTSVLAGLHFRNEAVKLLANALIA